MIETRKKLGIVVLRVGRGTETYIRKHIEDLMPGRVAVCALADAEESAWRPSCPTKILYPPRQSWAQLWRRATSAFGPQPAELMDRLRVGTWCISEDIHVLLCEYLQVAVGVHYVAGKLGIPIYAHAHGYDASGKLRDPAWRQMYRSVLPQLAAIIVVSENMKERVVSLGVAPERVHVVPCCPSVDSDPPVRTVGRGRVVAIGRIIEKKGPLFLMESFRQILDVCPEATLDLLGDGPLREPVRQFVAIHGMEHAVRIHGEQPHEVALRVMKGADLLLQHSIVAGNGDEEGLPVSILEAMAQGIPVVATRIAGIAEAVLDGCTGYLVEAGDCSAMANQARILLTDEARNLQFGIAAWRRALDCFSWERERTALRSLIDPHLM